MLRAIEFEGLKIGGEGGFPFTDGAKKPVFALEVLASQGPDALLAAQSAPCDLICVKFDIPNFENLFEITQKPLILRGSGDKFADVELLSKLAQTAKKPCIIAYAEELNYKDILPSIIKHGHIAVLRAPIDINLTKELNILSCEFGLGADKILIDPDMGGLGYGLDYGYSIIERIKLAAFEGDKMLSMPIIVFAGEEANKAKEAKSADFGPSWGALEDRKINWEATTAMAVVAAGANAVVMRNAQALRVVKEALC